MDVSISQSYDVQFIIATPGEPYPGGPQSARKLWEECGDDRFCIGVPNTVKACGSFLGQSDICCYTQVWNRTSNEAILQPCNNIPEIQDKTIDKIGVPNGDCNVDDTGINFLNTTGPNSCCPSNIQKYLEFGHPSSEIFGLTQYSEYRCANFTIDRIVPKIKFEPPPSDGTDDGGDSPTPTDPSTPSPSDSDSPASGGSDGGSNGGSSGGSSETSTNPDTNSESSSSSSPPATSTPNAASKPICSSKLSSFILGSALFAMFIGAQI